MNSPFTKDELKRQLDGILEFDFRTDAQNATITQVYRALSSVVVNYLKEKRHNFMHDCNSKGRKQVYYLSMEFLMGRSLKTSLYNLGMQDVAEEALNDMGIKIDSVYDEEPDAGLGNGGLGRLAACYMDGLATCDYPLPVTLSVMSTVSSNRRSLTAGRPSFPITGSPAAALGSFRFPTRLSRYISTVRSTSTGRITTTTLSTSTIPQ